jgi:hypothetical protein
MKENNIMVCRQFNLLENVFALVLVFGLVLCFCPIAQAEESATLLEDVVSLQLGMNGYVVGEKLTKEQKKTAAENPVAGGYKGTYKFRDRNLNIVADKKEDRVLALYRQVGEADKKKLKQMVVELMNLFDAPTTMAHDKILYWAFNKHGKISEEVFDRAKEAKQTPQLGIIATVKLNSEIEILPDQDEEEQEGGKDREKNLTGAVYFIITSDPLVQKFMAEQT